MGRGVVGSEGVALGYLEPRLLGMKDSEGDRLGAGDDVGVKDAVGVCDEPLVVPDKNGGINVLLIVLLVLSFNQTEN